MKKNTYRQMLLASVLIFFFSNVSGQEEALNNSPSTSNSAGISIGWYNPSLDYWKESINSEFKDADFNGAIYVKGFYERQIIKNLNFQIGLGYWQSTTEADLQGFGNTKMLLTGIPVNIDIHYHLEPLKFSVITPYIGVGGEYVFVQYKLNFEQNDNPDPVTGSTFMGNALIGLEAKLSDYFAMDLEFRYKFGSYDQDFKSAVENPENPDEPTYETVTETISLNGPFVGITFKYLF
jgi:hypothetical protein